MSSNGNSPASPTVDANRDEDYGTRGLSKRELIAALALANMAVSHSPRGYDYSKPAVIPQAVTAAVAYADALLAELEKSP